MKLNAILPFLLPVLIAGGLIGYNEMNDNALLEMLKNDSIQIQNFDQNTVVEIEQIEQPNIIQETENTTNNNVENNPKTVTLENTDVALVTETQITLTNNNHNIKTNDIIVAGVLDNAPLGFLRKVTNISDANGTIVLQTEKASLSDAYANEIANPVQESDATNSNNSYTFQPDDLVMDDNTEPSSN